MIEPHTSRTYDEAFARAHSERAAAFRRLFGLDGKRRNRMTGWTLFHRFA